MYKNIDHICIFSKNADKLSKWYQKIFGFEIALKMERREPIFFLKLGDKSLIEIIPISEKNIDTRKTQRIGFNHISIIVDDFGKACEDLTSKGIILNEVRKTSQNWKIAYFNDPEDNILQIEYRQKMLW
ncbi:hypothetical protein ES704_03304 [subsurface metagenome]|jgi:catechol 2,3-dioxygenase-like lactoylglutathione lyase family enzyme